MRCGVKQIKYGISMIQSLLRNLFLEMLSKPGSRQTYSKSMVNSSFVQDLGGPPRGAECWPLELRPKWDTISKDIDCKKIIKKNDKKGSFWSCFNHYNNSVHQGVTEYFLNLTLYIQEIIFSFFCILKNLLRKRNLCLIRCFTLEYRGTDFEGNSERKIGLEEVGCW